MVKEIVNEEEGTHIRVNRDVYVWLEGKKIHPRQAFNEVLEEIMRQEKEVLRR